MLSPKILEYLKRNLLFEGIPDEELQNLEDDFFQLKEYQKEDLIIEQDADPDGVYLILKGSVVVKKSTMKDTTDDELNKEIILNYCSKNEFVGELALVSNKKRAANVYAFSSVCRIIFINTADFYRIYEIIPGIQKNLGKTIAERLGETSIRAANESSKYKKLYELQLENSVRTTQLLKTQKEFEKRNLELLQSQKEIKRTAIVETILTMINSIHKDLDSGLKTVFENITKLKDITNTDGSAEMKAIVETIAKEFEDVKSKLDLYSDQATLEFGNDDQGRKVIIFKPRENE
ncbi:MAG: cyclic nucleotide-binding domain-containing protein [Candidatus Delongbacteria bacterium]|jgi:CRP-like cAMP-binding protein|nr:cyclic nucleotide-binding domain-containing protein [Candidatus Delongbacteria bacterium]MDD4205576.1 cyclic nucleotide-binding domain-containing protein [Candidatus Delongbacteria bacterium]MDY0017021.1 cyclic nucleotide-binding domain-containing protein [Candidatus Delongbacteria bacterium]